ncbi:hypothetical protein [Rhizobium sp. CIAT894]|nr:hypothetical protein [Rhizobium sp. CIAT894]
MPRARGRFALSVRISASPRWPALLVTNIVIAPPPQCFGGEGYKDR